MKGVPTMTASTHTTDGRVPTEGDVFAKQYEPCENGPVYTVPTHPAEATLTEVVTYLRRLGEGKGGDAKFATSLVAYYDRTGGLTEKQARHARRLYSRWYGHRLHLVRYCNGQHDWTREGTVVWHVNHVLGTYAFTAYYRCENCGKWQGLYENHNYSGD